MIIYYYYVLKYFDENTLRPIPVKLVNNLVFILRQTFMFIFIFHKYSKHYVLSLSDRLRSAGFSYL